MEREQFEALVQRLEALAEQNPRGYKARVLALALLGYGYILFVLAILLATLIGLILLVVRTHHGGYAAGKIGLLLLGLIYVVVRSLWVKIEPPAGLALTAQEAPELFALIDGIAAKLQSRRPDVVLLTDEFNCGVAQVPRLGVFGWYREYLVLGLPMLHALSPDEFKAVLAHEFGHLSSNHSRFAGWIYRVRAAWYQLTESFKGEGGAVLFGWFFNWYAPFFGAYSFVLARADEYVADRCACEVAGSRASADALLRTSVAGSFLQEKFWPGIFRQANAQSVPPPPFSHLKGALCVFEPEPAQRWVNRALAEMTGGADTHPALTDRLTAMGEGARVPPPLAKSAAEEFLGARLDDLTSLMNTAWTQAMAEAWQARHKEQQEAQAKLRELEDKAISADGLSEAEALQRAVWIEEFRGEDEGTQAFRDFVAAYPESAPGHFALGRLLLERGEESGVAHVEKAMALEPDAILPGCQVLHNFLAEQGRADEARDVFQRAVKQSDVLEAEMEERNRLLPGDTLLPHELNEEALATLRTALQNDTRLKEAHLARKQLQHRAERPLYVLGVVFDAKWYQVEDEAKFHQWAQELAQSLPLPGECFVVPLHGATASFKKPLEKVPGAKVFERAK